MPRDSPVVRHAAEVGLACEVGSACRDINLGGVPYRHSTVVEAPFKEALRCTRLSKAVREFTAGVILWATVLRRERCGLARTHASQAIIIEKPHRVRAVSCCSDYYAACQVGESVRENMIEGESQVVNKR